MRKTRISVRLVAALAALSAGTIIGMSDGPVYAASTRTCATTTCDANSVDTAAAQTFTYKYYYVLKYPPAPSPGQVTRMAENNFSRYFPFSGCGTRIYLGEVCHLGEGPGGNNPIRVEDVSPTSFTFLSLPGHFEGPNRLITFTFYTDSDTNRLFLAVWSRGPISPGSVFSVISGVANGFWQQYAENLAGGIVNGDYRNY